MDVFWDTLHKVGFEWQVALSNLVTFLIILVILNVFVFKKLGNVIAKRNAKIKKGLEDAQLADTALMMAKEKEKGLLKEAHVESSNIVERAYAEAQETIGQSKQNAEIEAQKILDLASKKIEKQKIELEKELHKKTVDIVISGIEKVLAEEMTSEMQERIVKKITA